MEQTPAKHVRMRVQNLLGVLLTIFAIGAGLSYRLRAVNATPQSVKAVDLSRYQLIFSEDFSGPLDVSDWGPGTRWIAHTPWNGDFGDAKFANPMEGFPFVVENGVLRIEARKDPNARAGTKAWRSGLLASNAPDGTGFSLQYGYFEMSARLPPDKGVWAAFWLVSSGNRLDKTSLDDGHVEIDVLEFYGLPEAYSEVIHVWKPAPHRSVPHSVTTVPAAASKAFHRYGAAVTREWIICYLDRVEVWRTPTPPEHNKPLMVLLNLALGAGWPIDKVTNPSFMYVDYVRAYAEREPQLKTR
jgi:beta-glucanase (GH16 family)